MHVTGAHPLAIRHQIERRERDSEHAEQDVRKSQVRDEDVGHGLHSLVADHDEADECVPHDPDNENHDVETVEEGFD